MTRQLNLPPVYTLDVVDSGDARGHAVAMAETGAEAGLFVWRPALDWVDCALVLRPEEEAGEILPAIMVAAIAMLDGLGSAGPAAVACDLVWPATLRVNGGTVGGAALDLAPGDLPDWAVVSVTLRKTGLPGIESGERPDIAALAEEGFAEMEDSALMEAFARHFLVWMDRWQEGGLAAITPHWLDRARAGGGDTVLELDGELVAGTIQGLDASGGLQLETLSGPRTIPLTPQLAGRDPLAE